MSKFNKIMDKIAAKLKTKEDLAKASKSTTTNDTKKTTSTPVAWPPAKIKIMGVEFKMVILESNCTGGE